MGNCCFGGNIASYKEENEFLKKRLIEKEEQLSQSRLENNIYKYQNIMIKAYYKNNLKK